MSQNYVLNWSDLVLKAPLTIPPSTIDSASTDIHIDGESSLLWGEGLNEDWLKLLDHFTTSSTPPSQPTEGELWFVAGAQTMKVWFNGTWHDLTGRIDGTAPQELSPIVGDLWYDTTNNLLKVYTNSFTWISVCLQCVYLTPSPTPTPSPTASGATSSPTPAPVYYVDPGYVATNYEEVH
jgi:hypothetical protein